MVKNNFINRVLQILVVLFGISFFTFSLTYLSPGDPAEVMLTECGNIPTPELLAQTRAELGLDKPFAEQYCRWAGHVVQGELGKSYSLRVPVVDKIKTAFMPTLKLSLLSLAFMIVISLPLGTLAALKVNKWQDYFVRAISFTGLSIPSFWLGLIFLSIFGVMLHWVTVSGGKADFKSMILPAFTLGFAMSAKYIRQVRHTVLEELNKDYEKLSQEIVVTTTEILKNIKGVYINKYEIEDFMESIEKYITYLTQYVEISYNKA